MYFIMGQIKQIYVVRGHRPILEVTHRSIVSMDHVNVCQCGKKLNVTGHKFHSKHRHIDKPHKF